jgi:hypothetical protein
MVHHLGITYDPTFEQILRLGMYLSPSALPEPLAAVCSLRMGSAPIVMQQGFSHPSDHVKHLASNLRHSSNQR